MLSRAGNIVIYLQRNHFITCESCIHRAINRISSYRLMLYILLHVLEVGKVSSLEVRQNIGLR